MTREKAMKAFNFALAAALVGAAVQSTPAVASDNTWACEVVLCISNPGGPTQYPACVPPITKLWRVLALGGSFPTCTGRSEEHTSELQSLMRISYAVFCLKKKKINKDRIQQTIEHILYVATTKLA